MVQIFSPAEKLVLEILGRRKMTIASITEEYCNTLQKDLMMPNNYIAAVIRRIALKCEHYNLNWTLTGQGSGRGGRTVWREPREVKKR